MSRFLSPFMRGVAPYVPGQQPREGQFIKLNTNENPYPPSPKVAKVLREFSAEKLRLYSEISDISLNRVMAESRGLGPDQVFAGGGSDEVLGFAFMAFFEKGDRVYFPSVTYGFYQVYADLFGLRACPIPLKDDFSVDPADYYGLDGHIFLANPNAPTGLCLSQGEIEGILRHNPDRLVVVDEAYIDFTRERSCVELINRYDNLLVVQTFSKSRALAGMRLGFGFGCGELIDGLDRARFSFNPYNLDWVSIEVGKAAILDEVYTGRIVRKIVATRERVARELTALDFKVLPSQTNFLFAQACWMGGGELYECLRQRGVLVRHFPKEPIADYLRISIGTDGEMDVMLEILRELRSGSGQEGTHV